MATFGQGINAQLGAIDYSPIQRGSAVGAQLAAQGGSMIGQGLANLGQEVGQGIQKYAEQKKKNAERDGRVNTAISSLQSIAKTMDKYGRKDEAEALRLAGYNLIQEPNLDKRAAMADTAIGSFLQGQQIEAGAKQRQLGEQAAQYVRAATQADGKPFSAVVRDVAGGYSPMGAEAQTLGQRQYQQQQLVDSEIAKNLREKQAAAGMEMTPEQVAAIPAGTDYKGVPMPNGNIYVTGMSRFAPAAQNVINMGENSFNKALGTELAPRLLKNYDNVIDAPNKLEKLYELQDLVTKGDVTTGAGAEYINALNRVRAQFLGDIKANKTVTNTQILDTLLGAGVFGAISEQKLGSKNFDTPAEMKNIRAAFVGDTGFTNDSIRAITDYRIKAEKIAAKRYASDQKAGVYDNFYKETKLPKPDFNAIPPEGVTLTEWRRMTPEAKALWNK